MRRNDRQRAEIARQTEEFLNAGGEITVLPNNLGNPTTIYFGRQPVVDPITGRVMSDMPRYERNGRMVLRAIGLAKALKCTPQTARRIAKRSEGFPAPLPGVTPICWDEEEVLNWIERTGFSAARR
jgi:hypothetical protein